LYIHYLRFYFLDYQLLSLQQQIHPLLLLHHLQLHLVGYRLAVSRVGRLKLVARPLQVVAVVWRVQAAPNK
jgi:hypothetical protein